MIYVFSGNDRQKIAEEVKKILGEDYEIFEGENLGAQELMNIFRGTSLFGTERKILIKDLTAPAGKGGDGIDPYAEILNYVDTPHTIVIWESSVSRKKSYKDFTRLKQVSEKKIDRAVKVDMRKVFEVFDTAYRDGPRAVKMLAEIQEENDPYMFLGLLASQAIKKYEVRAGAKEKRVLLELSKLDMQMKSTAIEPWTLISSFLLQVSSL